MSVWRKYLLWFAQEHIDFRYAEIQSLLKLWNIQYKPSTLPNYKSEVILKLINDNKITIIPTNVKMQLLLDSLLDNRATE